MKYNCRIVGAEMICTLTSDRDLVAPVFCCAAMAPLAVSAGGVLKTGIGGYSEITLPDLRAGQRHELRLHYADGYQPANRAWMPMGPYLETAEGIITLPPTPTGRHVPPAAAPEPFDGLPILPQPTKWEPSKGHLATNGFACSDGALQAVADLATRQGMAFAGPTPVELIDADLPPEAYVLTITGDGVTIAASGYGGRFYAGITLLTLLQQGPLPCGQITDTPRFGWRGQHLDTARHYYQPDTILALLDLMALLKLNRFHWHFADDEAFRLEINGLPDLWQGSAIRGKGHKVPGIFSAAPEAGGCYLKSDARAIIGHAKALNIEVLPEIEVPAHAFAMAALYPDTRDPDDTGKERSVQGYNANVMNPAMPRSWEIWETLVTEIGALFPFGHIHLGCDELPEETWMGSPKARALMAAEGLETTNDLQGWTIAKLAGFAVKQGLRPAAWEEAARGNQGGIGHDAILFSWTGQGPGIEAARAGHNVVMCPGQHVYLDMAHTSDRDDWGASWAAFIDLPDTIAWNPVPDPAIAEQIIGVQGEFWSEFTSEDHMLWPMLMPRMLGVAAMAWQTKQPDMATLGPLSTRYQVDRSGKVSVLGSGGVARE